MNFFGNITIRKPRRTQSETHVTDDESSTSKNTIDVSTNSMPELTDEEDEEKHCSKTEIERLTNELKIAHNEIANLNLENEKLKKEIDGLQKKQNLCKKITDSLKNDCVTPKKNKGKFLKSQPSSQYSPKPCSSRESAEEKNSKLTKPRANSQEKNAQSKSCLGIKLPNQTSIPTSGNSTQKIKICLLTCNTKNAVLDIAESIFTNNDYNICHFLTPYAGIKDQLNGLNEKLSSFTKNDFCIVMIGEEEFTKTNNYHDLIAHIRDELEKIVHTNVIICTPTFKIGQHHNMFNWRVELFNHLLYSDVLKNEYAYLWDSNTTISYDYNMFTRRYGHLNNRGLRNILSCIHQQIELRENKEELTVGTPNKIEETMNHYINNVNETTEDFFRE